MKVDSKFYGIYLDGEIQKGTNGYGDVSTGHRNPFVVCRWVYLHVTDCIVAPVGNAITPW
jgi:hypothetical protein